MTTALDPQTAKRLAFLRMVYEQGVQQSRLPAPLNAPALLFFHDSVELFLVLVGDHLRAQLDKKTNFLDYWDRLKKAPNGVHLSCHAGMRRLNDHRNGLKHAGNMPTPDVLDQARTDVAAFFDDNVPRVFDGLPFDSIDMSDVIPQDEVRAEAKEASRRASDGSLALAMMSLSYAYAVLMQSRAVRDFGPPLRKVPFFSGSLESAFRRFGDNRTARLGARLGGVSEAVVEMQDAMRIMALGLDVNQYRRFWDLLPDIPYHDKDKDAEVAIRDEERGQVADREEFEFCRQFLVTAALRIADVEAHQQMPSWQRRRMQGGGR
ncbi:hypothetical protein [Streptomyces sp. IB201691-2A2]|uniref:hypothetical protein n=1 Tax=Streptomyces sp. IB201691-2A2 TaxID=2561920 RepID=UPI00117F294D|nr:hypothetical protein [Streptomyces sp. IB201691-2A2]TRO55811.1 hypothetical protein E4K73_49175 [Streptomyces sp. IB201691-2A2]